MEDWRGRDLLSSVHEVCRLHWRKRGQPDVQIEELETAGLAYLRVSYTHGPWTKHEVLGVLDGQPDEPVLRRLRSLAGNADTELVFRGENPPEAVGEFARDSRIWLRGFDEYQTGLWDPARYLRTQNARLAGDPEYPLALHVDKRWAMLGAADPAEQTATAAILSWLDTPGPAFVLVLGVFGSGKTFLLRSLAHELATREGLIPVLITMRDLEKGRTLDELLAQHMTRNDEDPFHGGAFRYLLRPYQATSVLLPGFVADQPQQPEDLVGIGPEVDAFAHLIASKRLVPPLAVGMLGDWGSAKSHFLRSLQRRIAEVTGCQSTVARLLGTAATYVAAAGKYIRDATERIANAQSKLAEAEQQEHDRIASKVDSAQQTLADVQSRLDSAIQREQDLTAGLAELQRSLDAVTPGQVLVDFITERLHSDDYRRHLGVPALVRRDLERLSRLMTAQQPGRYSIDRIVLYIDDLDRCPTTMVIKVLKAVHLLLAFPLFVVVVAVDARWLASSLRQHYGQLSGPDAMPEDYLEKIFQVPFPIQPLPPRQREQMVRGLLMPSIMEPIAQRQPTSVEVTVPETDVDEFTRVVLSFSDTASSRQALSDAVNLTVSTGLPLLADAIFPALVNDSTLPVPSEEDPHYEEYCTFTTWLDGRSLGREGLHEWLDLIYRFRFPEGRAGHETGRMAR